MKGTLVRPTDRGHQTPESGVGVDTIALVGPTNTSTLYELGNIKHRRLIDRESGEVVDYAHGGFNSIRAGAGTVGVSVWLVEGGAARMRLQASVPRFLHGHNWDGIDPRHLPDALETMLADVRRELRYVPALHQVRVSRLDLTRDFYDVRDAPATLAAIARHPMPRASVNRHELRSDGTSIQTLYRGNRTYWLARGYDKWHQATTSGRDVPAGLASKRPLQLRFEVELKSRELRHRGLTTVGALADEDLYEMTRHYFERTNFDVNTAQTGISDLLTRLSDDGISPADRRNLLLYLHELEHGVHLLSRGSRERSRALANRYKVGAGSIGTSTFTRRLDFDSAREIVD